MSRFETDGFDEQAQNFRHKRKLKAAAGPMADLAATETPWWRESLTPETRAALEEKEGAEANR